MKNMKKKWAIVAFLTAITMTATSIVGCSGCNLLKNGGNSTSSTSGSVSSKTDAEQIEEVVQEFLQSYNDGDFEGVLDCMTAKTANAMRALFNLLGGIAGGKLGVDIQLSDLFSLGVATADGDFMNLNITNIEVNGIQAVVTTNMRLTGADTQAIYFELKKENGKWLIEDMTDSKPSIDETQGDSDGSDDVSNDTGGGIDKISVSSASYNAVYDDVAIVQYTKDSVRYYGYVNSKGEIFYNNSYTDTIYFWTSTGNGTGYFIDNGIATILTTQGEVIGTSESLGFDKIIGSGDGLLLVYKDNSTISEEKHCYGVIDATDGSWVQSLTPYKNLGDSWNDYRYLGNGVFYKDEYVYYDSKTNQAWETYEVVRLDGIMTQGEGYGRTSSSWLPVPRIWRYGEEETYIDLPYFFKYQDNEFVEVSEEEYYLNSGEIRIDTSGEYLKIYGPYENVSEYTNFSTSMFRNDYSVNVHVIGEYIFVPINGQDGKQYFTMINTLGVQQFSPIAYANYSDIEFFNERIVYTPADKDYKEVIDFQGNVIISADKQYKSISYLGAGIFEGADNDYSSYAYYNVNGKETTFILLEE